MRFPDGPTGIFVAILYVIVFLACIWGVVKVVEILAAS